jgi:hypothetical protein
MLNQYARRLPVLLIFATSSSGCAALSNKKAPNPLDELAPSDQFETIVLFSSGNLQGALLPSEPNQGGAALLESYYKIAQKDFAGSIVWLDAGNLRGDSPEYGFDQGRSFEEFLLRSGISVTLDGTGHASRSSEPKPPAPPASTAGTSSSTSDTADDAATSILGAPPGASSRPSESMPPSLSSLSVKELRKDSPNHTLIHAGRIQLGVISANSRAQVEQESAAARAEGADLVVWLTRLPIHCSPHLDKIPSLFRKPGEPTGFCEGSLNDVVTELTPGTLDAVITSGGDKLVQQFLYPRYSANSVDGIPVVEVSPFGTHVDLIYLTYDMKNHHRELSKTRIEGPVAVSEAAQDPSTGNPTRTRFHGRNVEPDSEIASLSKPAQNWIEEQDKLVLAQSKTQIQSDSFGESAFGDLVADAIRTQTQSDFSLVHPGLSKHAMGANALHPGPVTQANLIRALPADSPVLVIPVTGEELKTIVRVSENGSRGFASVSGMKLRLIKADHPAPATDLDENHHLSLWEQNRLLEMSLAAGTSTSPATSNDDDDSIHSKRTYKLAIPLFLVDGGDDWQWLSQHFALAQRIDAKATYPSTRDLVASYLKLQGTIDSIPTRIRFEIPSKGKSKSKRTHHHKRHKKPGSA